MRVRCPRCHNPVEIIDDSTFNEIVCSTCGSSFSLIGGTDETETCRASEKTVGHFTLTERLGIGAFGTVWKAKDSQLDRIVAIKVPRKGQLSNSWSSRNSNYRMHSVAELMPNEYGLFDMLGNVWELCLNRDVPYPDGTTHNPADDSEDYHPPNEGETRILRGGSFDRPPFLHRVSNRRSASPSLRLFEAGFRIARSIVEP